MRAGKLKEVKEEAGNRSVSPLITRKKGSKRMESGGLNEPSVWRAVDWKKKKSMPSEGLASLLRRKKRPRRKRGSSSLNSSEEGVSKWSRGKSQWVKEGRKGVRCLCSRKKWGRPMSTPCFRGKKKTAAGKKKHGKGEAGRRGEFSPRKKLFQQGEAYSFLGGNQGCRKVVS